MRAARKQVEAKRASMTPEGQKEHAMATRLQNLQRSKTARMAAKELQARKMAIKRQMVLADSAFQKSVTDIMESTVSNLLAEVLHGEFNLSAPPTQVTYAASSPGGGSGT